MSKYYSELNLGRLSVLVRENSASSASVIGGRICRCEGLNQTAQL